MGSTLARVALVCCALLCPMSVGATPGNPDWKELNAQQRDVLAPIQTEWAHMDAARRLKWLGIAKHFPSLSLYEQWKTRQRMQEWARLTPAQRRAARERYQEFEQLPAKRKEDLREHWEQKKNEAAAASAAR